MVKILRFEQNNQRDSDVLILPNFMFFRTGVVKNPKFEHNFQRDSDFLILPNFNVLQDPGGQNEQKF